MSAIVSTLAGARPIARPPGAPPIPGADILRRLAGFAAATDLAVDDGIGARDPRFAHCVHLPGPGLLVTATRAGAPLLQPNGIALAEASGMHVLLLRCCATHGTSAALFLNTPGGHLVVREGYRAEPLAQGGILLRHPRADAADYLVGATGLWPTGAGATRRDPTPCAPDAGQRQDRGRAT